MLDGREPESEKDWALVMNFLAANVHPEIASSACRALAKMYGMGLSDHASARVEAIARTPCSGFGRRITVLPEDDRRARRANPD